MLTPIVCLSLFAVSAQASVELRGVLELPRAIQSLMESQRFKRQFGSDRTTQCMASCTQDLNCAIQSLGMEESTTTFLNSRLFDPDTFNSFCEGFHQWDSCSGACPYSQMKNHLKKVFQPIKSLCGEDKETFESHRVCYQQSEPRQDRICDPKCGGQEEVKEEMNKLKSAAGDLDATSRIITSACEVISCQIDCRIPIIYTDCQDKEAALFVGRWAQKSMKQVLGLLDGLDLDYQCDIINFNPDKFVFDEPQEIHLPEVPREVTYGKSWHHDHNFAPQSASNNLFLIVVSIFAWLFL